MGLYVVSAASRSLLLSDEPIRLVPPNECGEIGLTDAADNKRSTGVTKLSSCNGRGNNHYLQYLFGGHNTENQRYYFMGNYFMQSKFTESGPQIRMRVPI